MYVYCVLWHSTQYFSTLVKRVISVEITPWTETEVHYQQHQTADTVVDHRGSSNHWLTETMCQKPQQNLKWFKFKMIIQSSVREPVVICSTTARSLYEFLVLPQGACSTDWVLVSGHREKHLHQCFWIHRNVLNTVSVLQTNEHPNPGKKFSARGFPRHCYLPDNDKGRKVGETGDVGDELTLVTFCT